MNYITDVGLTQFENETDCLSTCNNPTCLALLNIEQNEDYKPYFNKIIDSIYYVNNIEKINVSEMDSYNYQTLRKFTAQDMFYAMLQIVKIFKK